MSETVAETSSGAQVRGKRPSKPTVRTGHTASDNQVARALGERKKLNSEQTALKKQAALQKKQKEQAMTDAEREEDMSLFPVNHPSKRALFAEPSVSSMMPRTNELMSDEENDCEDDQPTGTVADLDLDHDVIDDEDGELEDEDEDETTSYKPSISDFSEYPRFFLCQ